MKWKPGFVFLVFLLPLAACQGREEPAQTENAPAAETAPAPPAGEAGETTDPGTGASPADAAAADAADPGSSTPGGTAAPAGGGAAVASQETNWPGIVAEVTEFRRKGNTLTAKVRLRNQGSAETQPDIMYKEVYLMDLGAGKKYEVLKDEKGTYIAALRQNWNDRWYQDLKPGEAQTIWMKFPAPPADVKTVTLQIPGAPPFEDLPIQDV